MEKKKTENKPKALYEIMN